MPPDITAHWAHSARSGPRTLRAGISWARQSPLGYTATTVRVAPSGLDQDGLARAFAARQSTASASGDARASARSVLMLVDYSGRRWPSVSRPQVARLMLVQFSPSYAQPKIETRRTQRNTPMRCAVSGHEVSRTCGSLCPPGLVHQRDAWSLFYGAPGTWARDLQVTPLSSPHGEWPRREVRPPPPTGKTSGSVGPGTEGRSGGAVKVCRW